jgi:O-antigen/teichoic acid export membrane protein
MIARVLGPHDYGTYSLYIWYSAVFIIVTNGGLTTAAIKFIAEYSEKLEAANGIVGYLFRKQIKHLLVIFTLSIIGILILSSSNMEIKLLLMILLAASLKSIYMFFTGIAKGFERFDFIAYVIFIVAPLNILLIYLAFINTDKLDYYIGIYLLISLMYVITMFFVLRKHDVDVHPAYAPDKTVTVRIDHHVRVISFSIIFSFIILKQSEIFFLDIFSTKEDIAIFNVAYLLATSGALLLPGIVTGLLLPYITRIINRDKKRLAGTYLTSIKFILILGIPLVFVTPIISEPVINLLYGKNYILAAMYFELMMIPAVIVTVSQVASSNLMGHDQQSTVFKITVFTVIIGILLDILLIREYGLNGAVAAYSITILAQSTITFYFSGKLLNVKYNYIQYSLILLTGIITYITCDYLVSDAEGITVLLVLIPFAILYLFLIWVMPILTSSEKQIVIQKVKQIYGNI